METDLTGPGFEIPFETWLAEGEKSEIPWELTIGAAELSYYLRLRTAIRARVSSNWFRRYPGEHSVILAVRLADENGRWLGREGTVAGRTAAVLPSGATVQFLLEPFVGPGTYSIAVILFDRTTGKKSVTWRSLTVPAPPDPLLARAWEGLPAVEFPRDELRGLDRLYLPALAPVKLAARSERGVRVELVVNLSVPEELTGPVDVRWPTIGSLAVLPKTTAEMLRRAERSSVRTLLPVLRTLSQLRVENGSVRLTVIDVTQRRILAETSEPWQLDWPALRKEMEKRNALTVDAGVLAGRLQSAEFFRDVLASRLEAGGGSTGEERRIVVLVRSPQVLPRGTSFPALGAAGNCECEVYDLRLPVARDNIWDELDRVYKPLPAKKFMIGNPAEFRKALQQLLGEFAP